MGVGVGGRQRSARPNRLTLCDDKCSVLVNLGNPHRKVEVLIFDRPKSARVTACNVGTTLDAVPSKQSPSQLVILRPIPTMEPGCARNDRRGVRAAARDNNIRPSAEGRDDASGADIGIRRVGLEVPPRQGTRILEVRERLACLLQLGEARNQVVAVDVGHLQVVDALFREKGDDGLGEAAGVEGACGGEDLGALQSDGGGSGFEVVKEGTLVPEFGVFAHLERAGCEVLLSEVSVSGEGEVVSWR